MNLIAQILLVAGAGVVLGYGLFIVINAAVPRRLLRENQNKKTEIVKEASRQAQKILNDSKHSSEEKLQLYREEWEETLKSAQETVDLLTGDLTSSEESMKLEEARIQRLEAKHQKNEERLHGVASQFQELVRRGDAVKGSLIEALERKASVDSAQLLHSTREQLTEDRRIECQKHVRNVLEELDAHVRKEAEKKLSNALARYAPNFSWPKTSGVVEVNDPAVIAALNQPEARLLSDLSELSEQVQIEPKLEEEASGILKLSGGFGPFREAVRRSLEELIKSGPNSWGKVQSVYTRHLQDVEQIALHLGGRACFELGIKPVHPQVQRLIGALNWRTSYRQNQWMHSLEVAKLAGIVASELGVDPDKAKRCGLLHDIGKAIDYRIEGSHAVISGDYADRYGESQEICDTVMSHHNDLVVETSLAHVLKVADTLSGARPGARVNLEAGYQTRLSGIDEAVRSFPGIVKVAIMNGGREVHVDVNNRRISAEELQALTASIVEKIANDVAFPGQIKVMVLRKFEAVAQA